MRAASRIIGILALEIRAALRHAGLNGRDIHTVTQAAAQVGKSGGCGRGAISNEKLQEMAGML